MPTRSVTTSGGEPDLNNAGVAFFGEIENSEFTDFERAANVNYWGVVNGTKPSCRM